jgi:type II secretory pathway component GspD/PulD (secretin)
LEVVQQVFSHFQDDVSSRHVDTVTVLKPESIPLAHAPAPVVIDALRAVYPAEPAATNAAKFSVDPKTNAVVVSGTAAQVCGVKAIIAFLDRQSSPLSNTEQLKGEAAKAQDEARMMSREMAKYESAVESLRRELEQRSVMSKELEEETRAGRERVRDLESLVSQYRAQLGIAENNASRPK